MEIMHKLGNAACALIALILTYTGLPLAPVVGLVIMMIADLVTGMVRAARNGEELTSHRFKSGFLVKLVILLVPATVAVVAQSAMSMYPGIGDLRDVVKFSVMAIIVGESVSVIGNIASAKYLTPKVEWDYLSWLMRRLYEVLKVLDKR